MEVINVKNLSKTFRVIKQKEGTFKTVRELFSKDYLCKKAINDVSFSVEKGEILGYIGPNGAGKSTTIKVLTGILVPTGGEVTVNGLIPYKNRKENAKKIGVVFGQRTQLWWDLPLKDSFNLLKYIYKIPQNIFQENMEIFSELLNLKDFIDTPVRQLSLGQRMRGDIAAALLHNPEILYLDEPTIGLDVVAKERIRDFIQEINKNKKVTIILTTHDMSDVEKLCNRIMLIDKGDIVYHGNIKNLKDSYNFRRRLVVDFEIKSPEIKIDGAEIVKMEGKRSWIEFDGNRITAAKLINLISASWPISDLTIEEPKIESVISKIYQEGKASMR